MAEYTTRQSQFREAEIAALMDTEAFMARAQNLYGYPNFICDTGGSICEWIDPENDADPLLEKLSEICLLIWIKGDDAHSQELIRRFDRAPKPMAYHPDFLARVWDEYLSKNNIKEEDVDPDAFIRWTYAQALAHRQPRYEAMARHGITVTAEEMHAVTNSDDFDALIASKL